MDKQLDLNELAIFHHVVRLGSFTGAARALGLPKSTVSRKVADLEESLGARLLERTTRRLRLTDVGQIVHEHATRVWQEAEDAKRAVGKLQEVPRGTLRVTLPLGFEQLGPIAARYLVRYPEVDLELTSSDRVIDLVEDRFDLAIRAGRLKDSTLVARPLGKMRSVVVASPSCLDRVGRPARPEDLRERECIAFAGSPEPLRWRLGQPGEEVDVQIRARLSANDFDIVKSASVAGLGFSLMPLHLAADALRQGALERVLADWCSAHVPLHVVYPSTRNISTKVKTFIEHLVAELRNPPWEIAPEG